MVSKEEIKKLAELARIDIEENEAESLKEDMNVILNYVGQVSEAVKDFKTKDNLEQPYNILREDTDPTESGAFSDAILAEMPKTEKGYLKVKKIL